MPPYTSPAGDSRYWKWLQATSPCQTELAWCHSTDAYALRSMIETGVLAPQRCKVFREQLLYCFYGRPAYRPASLTSVDIGGRAPVVVILDPAVSTHGRRLFPFDTGAFQRYKPFLHGSMRLQDFELTCPSDAHQRQVAAFFGSNRDYLRLKVRTPAASYAGAFEAQSLLSLFTDRNAEASDDRRAAIELQLTQNLPFEFPTVKALILPDEMRQAPYVESFLASRGAKIQILEYEMAPLKSAQQYQYFLETKVVELQDAWGFL
jgi:hypothetical protein